MTPTPWQDVLAHVTTLNDPQAPFSYAVDGDVIVGHWDIAKIRTLGLTSVSSYDDAYRIEIKPVDDGVFDWVEHRSTTEASAGPGKGSASVSRFRGKSVSFSFGTTVGVAGTSKGKPTPVGTWSFSTEEIKRPVMDYLESYGWNKKKGFLNRLFG